MPEALPNAPAPGTPPPPAPVTEPGNPVPPPPGSPSNPPPATPPPSTEPPKSQAAPAEYNLDVKDLGLPEGMQADEEVTAEFKGLAKELKLPKEAAQKVASLGVKLVQKQQAAMEKMRNDWAEASRNDKEFGGANLEKNLGLAKKARNAFGTPELNKFLDESGAGNHPEVIRAFYRVAQAVSEDVLVRGNRQPNAAPKSSTFSYDKSNHVQA